jgi:hypothetical protein
LLGFFYFPRFHWADPYSARNRYRDGPLSSLQW